LLIWHWKTLSGLAMVSASQGFVEFDQILLKIYANLGNPVAYK